MKKLLLAAAACLLGQNGEGDPIRVPPRPRPMQYAQPARERSQMYHDTRYTLPSGASVTVLVVDTPIAEDKLARHRVLVVETRTGAVSTTDISD